MVIDHCSYDFFTISYRHHISDISTLILTFDQGRQKLPLLTPKKCKNEGQKKGNSPNPCWHGLFAKNRVQIGLIWPPWPRLYFTSAYRGSPPCTLFQHPDNREIGYSNVLGGGGLVTPNSSCTGNYCGGKQSSWNFLRETNFYFELVSYQSKNTT